MPRKMTSEEIRAFLSHGTRTAKLATSGPGGQPHVMPVWFALDGEEVVFTTWSDSVKGRNLRRDPLARHPRSRRLPLHGWGTRQVRGRAAVPAHRRPGTAAVPAIRRRAPTGIAAERACVARGDRRPDRRARETQHDAQRLRTAHAQRRSLRPAGRFLDRSRRPARCAQVRTERVRPVDSRRTPRTRQARPGVRRALSVKRLTTRRRQLHCPATYESG